jgi:hypothetical protein
MKHIVGQNESVRLEIALTKYNGDNLVLKWLFMAKFRAGPGSKTGLGAIFWNSLLPIAT